MEYNKDSLVEEEEEYIRKQARWSRIAKKILNDSDFMELLDIIKKEHVDAFFNLPIDADITEYKVVHHSLLAIFQLKQRLKDFIINNEISEQKREMDEKLKDVNI